MIKWILICILISAIMLIAYAYSQQYKDKFDFYSNLKLFLDQFKINVAFKKEKIDKFLITIKPKKHFKTFIEIYQTFLQTNKLNFEEIKILDEEEKMQLADIIKNLGRLDAINEKNQIENYLCEVNQKLEIAKDEKNKLSPMILKLSLLFALGLAVILI